MGYQDEEDLPHVHQKSHFDTERCPPPVESTVPAMVRVWSKELPRYNREEFEREVARLDAEHGVVDGVISPSGDFTGKGDDGEPVRVSANGRAAFAFPGGVAEVRKPTREELVLSARQWATRAREELFEFEQLIAKPATNLHEMQQQRYQRPVPAAIGSALDRLDTVLKELAES